MPFAFYVRQAASRRLCSYVVCCLCTHSCSLSASRSRVHCHAPNPWHLARRGSRCSSALGLSYTFEVNEQGYSVTALRETYQPHAFNRAVILPTPHAGTVYASSAPFRRINGKAEGGELSSHHDGEKLRGSSTNVIDVVCSGPTIELEALGDGAVDAPLHLHHGERKKEWVRVKPTTGEHVTTSGESSIVDMRLIAVIEVKQPSTKRTSIMKSVLLGFCGALSEKKDPSANTNESAEMSGASSAPSEVVKISRVALLPADMSLADLNSGKEDNLAPIEALPMPVQVPLGKLNEDISLFLELEWMNVPGLSSVELIMEAVGDSDPGYAALEAFNNAQAISPASTSAPTEGLLAAMPHCEEFLKAEETVFCRRARLVRPILNIPSLTTSLLHLRSTSARCDTTAAPKPDELCHAGSVFLYRDYRSRRERM